MADPIAPLDLDQFFEGNSPMTGMALATHELANEYEKAGFSRREAVYLASATMNGTPGTAPES